MIVDLAAYHADATPILSPTPLMPLSTPKQLKLRENQSEAGQTESCLVYTSSKQSAQSPLSSPKRVLPAIVVELPSPVSNADYSSENSSCHAQSITNSVYAFFGDSPEQEQRLSNSPLRVQPVKELVELQTEKRFSLHQETTDADMEDQSGDSASIIVHFCHH